MGSAGTFHEFGGILWPGEDHSTTSGEPRAFAEPGLRSVFVCLTEGTKPVGRSTGLVSAPRWGFGVNGEGDFRVGVGELGMLMGRWGFGVFCVFFLVTQALFLR